ncbi:MAG TPA: transcription antitermination factor NusB [Nitrospiria bacterium]
MGSRRKSRELALQMLFHWDLNRGQTDWKALFWDVHRAPDPVMAFTNTLVDGVLEHGEEIDQLIEKHALNWKITRISNVDRNILRIAVFELIYMSDIPSNVTLDEAIEIAKRYSDEQAPSFVNGVLDHLLKEESIARRGA